MIRLFITVFTVITVPFLLVAVVEAKRPNCDRNSLSICYNQLQPFFLTNNLRLVLRGWTAQSIAVVNGGSNKHSRSQHQAPAVPLHRIFGVFREFCDLYSTFAECLEAHDAADCMEADLVGELNNVIVTVARRDRSESANKQQTPGVDLMRDFDHFRRLSNSFCVDTPENIRIHVVRCLSGAVSSPAFKDDQNSWMDSQFFTDGSLSSPASLLSASTCGRYLRQSQGPILQAFFRQEGCGEHLMTAMRLGAFLAELTMRTTNVTESLSSPRFSLCVRHLPPKIFETIVNETFYGSVAPPVEKTNNGNNQHHMVTPPPHTSATIGRVVVGGFVKQPVTLDELLASQQQTRGPIPVLKIEDSNKESSSKKSGFGGDNDQRFIPVTPEEEIDAAGDEAGDEVADDDRRDSPIETNYDDDADAAGDGGVSFMMADSPSTNRNTAKVLEANSQHRSSAASSASTSPSLPFIAHLNVKLTSTTILLSSFAMLVAF